MKKFKRWLIHKLGGLCEDDIIKPNITLVSKEKEVRRICAEFISDYEDMTLVNSAVTLQERRSTTLKTFMTENMDFMELSGAPVVYITK